jgi:hypothetical protein
LQKLVSSTSGQAVRELKTFPGTKFDDRVARPPRLWVFSDRCLVRTDLDALEQIGKFPAVDSRIIFTRAGLRISLGRISAAGHLQPCDA